MISAKVVADSKAPNGARLTTLEVIMPRYILAEGKTHRLVSGMLEQTTIETSIGLNDEYYLSKNSASSRAIPFNKMVREVQENPFIPYAWQKDHKGMQGSEYFQSENGDNVHKLTEAWLVARDSAIQMATGLNNLGVTKQLANRLLEPFMYHKVLISATEWENFFNLRCPSYTFHNDDSENDFVFKSRKEAIKSLGANNPVEFESGNIPLGELSLLQWLSVNTGQADIHMMFLAEAIYDAINESTPRELKEGEWHIPYGDNFDENKLFTIEEEIELQDDPALYEKEVVERKLKISIARCARLSYQTLGDNPEINYEKDLELYEVLSKSGHWSPFEHVAKVMNNDEYKSYFRQEGLKAELGWCRNFKGFRQYRELLD